jgi:hypothetical protein
MKKVVILILLVIALLLTGCRKELPVEEEKEIDNMVNLFIETVKSGDFNNYFDKHIFYTSQLRPDVLKDAFSFLKDSNFSYTKLEYKLEYDPFALETGVYDVFYDYLINYDDTEKEITFNFIKFKKDEEYKLYDIYGVAYEVPDPLSD